MARSIRFTKAERDLLKLILTEWADGTALVKMAKTARGIVAKVKASEEAEATVDVGPIEEALVAAARGKVIALEGGHARARVQATAVKATVEDAKLLGGWMARQGWLTGPMTLLDVLNKWYMWLPKARTTQPPPALGPGLGTDAPDVRSAPPTGQAPAGGRRAPGFR